MFIKSVDSDSHDLILYIPGCICYLQLCLKKYGNAVKTNLKNENDKI